MLRGPGRDARQVPGTRSAARPLPDGHVLTGDAPRGFGLSTFWMVRTQLDDVAEQLPRPRSVDVPAKAIRRVSVDPYVTRQLERPPTGPRDDRRRARLVPARDQLGAAHATRDISSRTTSGAGLTARDVLHRKAGVARHRQRGLGRRGGRGRAAVAGTDRSLQRQAQDQNYHFGLTRSRCISSGTPAGSRMAQLGTRPVIDRRVWQPTRGRTIST